MGVYFEYDFKNGKEVEKRESCYICGKDTVLYAEYYVEDGGVYKLYKDARKIIKGREVPVGSKVHAICDPCVKQYSTEEELVERILDRRLQEKKETYRKELEQISAQIEKKNQERAIKMKELELIEADIAELEKKAATVRSLLGEQ